MSGHTGGYYWNVTNVQCALLWGQKYPPRRGIEPRSPAWQAGILTTILPRTRQPMANILIVSDSRIFFGRSPIQLYQKKIISNRWKMQIHEQNKTVVVICSVHLCIEFASNHTEHRWSSGRILACHAGDPGSIPGRCTFLLDPTFFSFEMLSQILRKIWHLFVAFRH